MQNSPYLLQFIAYASAVLCCATVSVGCSEDVQEEQGLTWSGNEIVLTTNGSLRGFADDVAYAWLGVPFAQPPIGDLRWRAPQEVEPWEGVRAALEFPEVCSQFLASGPLYNMLDLGGSEDCLYLNVWRPLTLESNLPVYFWIHGGGNSIQLPLNENVVGANLANRSDVVVVSINYRLGPIGWFSHPAL